MEGDDRHTIDVSDKYVTLKVAGASRVDKGVYGVQLKNPQGEDKASFFVTVTGEDLFSIIFKGILKLLKFLKIRFNVGIFKD